MKDRDSNHSQWARAPGGFYSEGCRKRFSLSLSLPPPRPSLIFFKRKINELYYIAEEYFKRSIFIPYLDSIISSLRTRFSSTQEKAFSLLYLHQKEMNKLDNVSFLSVVEDINSLYGDILPNFTAGAMCYEMWKNKGIANLIPDWMTLIDEATPFYPAVSEALQISMTFPAKTCSIKRSFSTLRRIKNWYRSTMSDQRLNGLCMLSVHKKRVNNYPKSVKL